MWHDISGKTYSNNRDEGNDEFNDELYFDKNDDHGYTDGNYNDKKARIDGENSEMIDDEVCNNSGRITGISHNNESLVETT